MNTTIIFTPFHTGHNLEYLNILYRLCLTLTSQKFVFVVPEQIKEKLPLMKWKKAHHLQFDFLKMEEQKKYETRSLLRNHYEITKSISTRMRKHHANRGFSLFAYQLAIFGWLLFPRWVKVSGILYNIYLYDLAKLSFKKRLLNKLVFHLFARSKRFETLFVLNDRNGASRLRDIFQSNKFTKLPDPFTPPANVDNNIRTMYGIDERKTLLVHFGGLAKRKGTLNILKSIEFLSDEECNQYVFFFAGKVDESIRKDFMSLCHSQEKRVRIIVKNEFCSYGFLASLCEACNGILIPYLETSQSSGLLGYASYFKKPVIAPEQGLIGDLVKSYQLGIIGDVVNPQSLTSMYRQVADNKVVMPSDRYASDNSIDSFLNTLRVVIEDI